jgi:hypothetical protein
MLEREESNLGVEKNLLMSIITRLALNFEQGALCYLALAMFPRSV